MRSPTVLAPAQVAAELGRLGAQLCTARLEAGVSTRAAARAAGCNAGTLWRIE